MSISCDIYSNSNKRDKSKGQKKGGREGGRLDRGCTKYATDGYL